MKVKFVLGLHESNFELGAKYYKGEIIPLKIKHRVIAQLGMDETPVTAVIEVELRKGADGKYKLYLVGFCGYKRGCDPTAPADHSGDKPFHRCFGEVEFPIECVEDIIEAFDKGLVGKSISLIIVCPINTRQLKPFVVAITGGYYSRRYRKRSRRRSRGCD